MWLMTVDWRQFEKYVVNFVSNNSNKRHSTYKLLDNVVNDSRLQAILDLVK